MSQPRAIKVRTPKTYQRGGHTNYRIEGYQQHFRYVQGGVCSHGEGWNWKSTDAPRQINGKLVVVAALGSRFGVFEELSPELTHTPLTAPFAI